MTAYYNEHDPFAAAWLRKLIEGGHIARGEVDERSIEDIRPVDLASFTQCHFFAGIGGWSHALRLSGWPDDKPVWTGSCPCQPFSAAGKGGGFADERHLWPAFHWLIEQRRPDVVFGEQVEGPAGRAWLDLVFSDLEGSGYACGAAVFPAAGVGAPHGRHRTYWVADAADAGWERRGSGEARDGGSAPRVELERFCDVGGVAESDEGQRRRRAVDGLGERDGQDGRRPEDHGEPARRGGIGVVADAEGDGRGEERALFGGLAFRDRPQGLAAGLSAGGSDLRAGPVNGDWRDADWLLCRDQKWRPVEPGTRPLVDGASARVGKLRGYGNAIVPQAAAEFVKSYLDLVGTP